MEDRLPAAIEIEIYNEREAFHRRLLEGDDRFDGLPNWDEAVGGESALRRLASLLEVPVPSFEDADAQALASLRELYGEDRVLEYLESDEGRDPHPLVERARREEA